MTDTATVVSLPDVKTVAKMIDHAILTPTSTHEDVVRELAIAKEYEVAGVCVPPSYVPVAAEFLEGSGVNVGTVIGFPHGNQSTMVKMFEAVESVQNGAQEVDVVLNYGQILSGNINYVIQEVNEIMEVLKDSGVEVVKFIFENAYLNNEQISFVSSALSIMGVDFIKTSTGYATVDGPTGATVADVELMKANITDGSPTQIKASGGVRSLDDLLALYEAGATRFGTSGAKAILDTLAKRLEGNNDVNIVNAAAY